MKDTKVAPAPPAPDADRWLAALIVVVPTVVAIAACVVRADRDAGALEILGWSMVVWFFAPLSWTFAARRPLPRLLLPAGLLVLAGVVVGGTLGVVWWRRLDGDLANYGAAAPSWIGIGALLGACAGGSLLVGDVSLRLLIRRTADRGPSRFDEWIIGRRRRFLVFVGLVVPAAPGVLIALLYLTGESEAGGSWSASAAAGAVVMTVAAWFAANMLVEVGFVTWADARLVVLTGTVLWMAAFAWPRLPPVSWPILSFLWLAGLCSWRAPASAVVSVD